jgi:SAM-dependent methyltransferase
VSTERGPDPRAIDDATSAYSLRVWGYKQGEVVSLMIHLGDRLGLYRALAGAGRLDADALAERTGLHPRWLLEWLRGQAAAGLVRSEDGETFELPPEAVPVLVDDRSSVWYAAGAFTGAAAAPDVTDRLAEAFRTGRGLRYDDLGPEGARSVEQLLAPWSRAALVPVILPGAGLADRLEQGARVADVGCGAGVALASMARAYPRSRFFGYDPSGHALDRARANLDAAGVLNVELVEAPAEALPADASFDVILTLDCLHDMPHPERAAAAIRAATAGDGAWLIKEIRSGSTWAENLRNPVLAMMYGISVVTCLSSALSEPDGAGLGTLGLDPGSLERLVRDAGFKEFQQHDFGDPSGLYYTARP